MVMIQYIKVIRIETTNSGEMRHFKVEMTKEGGCDRREDRCLVG